MTTPVSDDVNKFGPGTLKIGETGTEIDVSCQVNNLVLTQAPNRGDSKVMLCGTTKAGSVTYDKTLEGNLDLDLDAGAEGLFYLSQQYPGSEQSFAFTPNTAGGDTAAGTLILDPMDFGSTEGYGAIMGSDVSWIVTDVTITPGTGGAVAVSGVTAGTPGSFQPGGATVPANLAALKADPVVGDAGTNKPSAAWTTGQSVLLGTGSAHWDGTAWITGAAA
jgi:hypothetical protein